MSVIQPIADVTNRAKHVLIQELGVIDTMRFLNQFRMGDGDYTVERESLFKNDSVKSIIAGIKAQRKRNA